MTVKSPAGQKQPNFGGMLSGNGIATSQFAPVPIPVNRWARNGKHPNAILESMKAEAGNAAVMFRTKEVFRTFGALSNGITSGGAGDRARFRFAFHTGPYTRFVICYVTMFAPVSSSTRSSYSRIDISDGTTTTSGSMYYGQYPGTTGLESMLPLQSQLTVQPDTDYTGVLVDVDDGIVHSACIWELASMTEFFSGYLPANFTSGGPILDLTRQNVATLANAMWRRGGAHLIAFCPDDAYNAGPVQTNSGGWVNVYDASSVNSPDSPGHIIDLTNHARLSQHSTGVPVVMKCYCWNSTAPGAGGGRIALVDQGGNAQLTLQQPATSAGWISVTGTLPAGLGKYDIMAKSDGATVFNVDAVSVYELES